MFKRFRLSEDWAATLTGLIIVVVIGSGLLGPGPHSVKITAEPGELMGENVHAVEGWTISAVLDGTTAPITGAKSDLQAGEQVVYICSEGMITVDDTFGPPDVFDAPGEDQAQIVLVNECASKVTLTLTIDAAIRWPVFGLFD